MRFVNLSATSERVGKGSKKRVILRKAADDQSAASPVLAFGDADTGFFQSSDDVLELTTAGVSRMKWDASGITTIAGNLVVSGTTTTIGSTTLTVDDKNIELGSVATPSDTTADGGGITIKGATDKTFNWVNSTDAWTSSEHINLASGKTFQLNGTAITSSAAELNYTDGVTSAIQTQMDAKLATTTAASTYAGLASPTFTGTLTATDIDLSGALSGSFLQETTTTISGTISEQKLVMADSATLSGNLTVNDRLVLAQMQDDKYGLDAHVKLLIHSDTTDTSTTFTDSSRLGTHTITAAGGAQHKTAQNQFGATSMYFDGTGDYLTIASHTDFNVLEDDFTIDMWVNFGTISNFDICDIKGYADGLSFRLREPGGTGYIGCYLENNSHTWAWVPATGTWYHLALIRYGSTIKCYVDGTALTNTAGGNPSGQSIAQGALQIGKELTGGTAQNYQGYIDEFRFSKGVARWTENFTVPYKAYQDSTPAILTGGYTITGSGTIENGLIDSTDQWEGSTYINTLGTVLEGTYNATIGRSATFPAGHILQTLTVHKTDSEALSTSTWTAVPGMSLAITPSSASSKILISVSMQVAGDDNMYILSGRLYRDSTAIGLADASGVTTQAFFTSGAQPWSNYNIQSMVNFYLDSPNTTSATTYSIKVWDTRNSDVVYINRHHYVNAPSDSPRGTSSMVLQEIAQ
jgi:hypothetical protein